MVDSARRHRHRQLSRHQRQIARPPRPAGSTHPAHKPQAAPQRPAGPVSKVARAARSQTCSCQERWPAAARRAGATTDSRRRPRRRPGPTARPRPTGGCRRLDRRHRPSRSARAGWRSRARASPPAWARAAAAQAGAGATTFGGGGAGGSSADLSRGAGSGASIATIFASMSRAAGACSAPCRETRGNRRRPFRRRRCGGSTRHD